MSKKKLRQDVADAFKSDPDKKAFFVKDKYQEKIKEMGTNGRSVDGYSIPMLPKIVEQDLILVNNNDNVIHIYPKEGGMEQLSGSLSKEGSLKNLEKKKDALFVVLDGEHYMGAMPER